jgi:D-serine deaminase-like pyridoxal phosphate-dependent protein
MLGMAGAEDVILAYQPVKPKFLRLLKLIDAYPGTKYSCLVDNIDSARMFSEIVSARIGSGLTVFIDLNVGMNRTGIKPAQAFDLFKELQNLPGIEFKGLHAYDGHIRDYDLAERIAHCDHDFKEAEELRNKIQSEGYGLPLLVAGEHQHLPFTHQNKMQNAAREHLFSGIRVIMMPFLSRNFSTQALY